MKRALVRSFWLMMMMMMVSDNGVFFVTRSGSINEERNQIVFDSGYNSTAYSIVRLVSS